MVVACYEAADARAADGSERDGGYVTELGLEDGIEVGAALDRNKAESSEKTAIMSLLFAN
jgi:hypothetical protein